MAQTTTEQTTEGTTEGTEAPGGHEAHGAFPPLNTATYPSQIFWLIIFFAALYVLMSKFALPRMGRILDTRKTKIEGDIASAQSLKDQTEAAVKAYEKALADARANANDIARTTREAVNKDVDAASHALDADLATKISSAEARIAKGKAKALDGVTDIAADAANDIVMALGGGKVTKAAVAKAIAAVAKG